jgi:uncharacterized protein (UPF0335 family)
MIEAARDKFGSLGVNELKFSAADTDTVDQAIARIQELEKEIATLEKGKIGNIFNDDSIKGADQVRKLIEELGGDVNNISFTDLSSKAQKDLNNLNSSLEKTRD